MRTLLLSLCVILSVVRAELNFAELFTNLDPAKVDWASLDPNNIDWDMVTESIKAFIRSLPSGDDIHGSYTTLGFPHMSQIEMDFALDGAMKRTLGIRRKLGMPLLGEAAGGESTDVQQNGMIAYGKAAVDCLMYSPGSKTSCSSTAEGLLIGYDTLGEVLSKIYMPWYLPDGMTLVSDMTALGSMVYNNCSVDKLMSTLTHLPTVEGATSMLSRVVVASNLEIKNFMDKSNDPLATGKDRGCAAGKAFGAVFKFNI